MSDELLYNDKFGPICRTIAFVKSDLETVAQAFKEWQLTLGIKQIGHVQSGTLWEMFQQIGVLCPLPTRILLVQTRSEWTSIFDNRLHGPDVARLAKQISRLLQTESIAVTAGLGPHPSCMLQQSVSGNYQRIIGRVKDGSRWAVFDEGSPFPFEPQSERKSVFDLERLRFFCKGLGIAPFDARFYEHAGVLYISSREGASQAEAPAQRIPL